MGSFSKEEVDAEYRKTRDLMESIGGFEELVKLPACEDAKLKAIMLIMEEMLTAAYWLGNQIEMFSFASQNCLPFFNQRHDFCFQHWYGLYGLWFCGNVQRV